jgi:hypothetical protein
MKTEKNRKSGRKWKNPKSIKDRKTPEKTNQKNSPEKEKKHQLGQAHAMRRAGGDY